MLARSVFDKQVQAVLTELPEVVLRLLDEVPLHIEDKPSRCLMKELHIETEDELCGIFQGIALSERNELNPRLPDSVTIFRKGILAQVAEEHGTISRKELRRQIRITILHEYAHLHGIDEDELEMLGYG
jgi:predicted Zn-dependent protease with MMP-like domain